MKKRLLSLAVLTAGLVGVQTANAQKEVSEVATTYTIDFTGFRGSGFIDDVAEGNARLNSTIWSVSGLKNGDEDVEFGDMLTDLGKSYSRGEFDVSNGLAAPFDEAAGLGGIYAAVNSGVDGNWDGDGSADTALALVPARVLAVSPTENYFNSGEVILKLENTTGEVIERVDLDFIAGVFDQGAAAAAYNVRFEYSLDQSSTPTFEPGPSSFDFSTEDIFGTGAANDGAYAEDQFEGKLVGTSGLDWQPGEFLLLKWALGSDGANGNADGNADELFDIVTLDDIEITVYTELNIVEFEDVTGFGYGNADDGWTVLAASATDSEGKFYTVEDHAADQNDLADVIWADIDINVGVDKGLASFGGCDVTIEILEAEEDEEGAVATTDDATDEGDFYLGGILEDVTSGATVVDFNTENKTLSFTATVDEIHEGDKVVRFKITAASAGCIVGANDELEIVIVENDKPYVDFVAATYTFDEDDSNDDLDVEIQVEDNNGDAMEAKIQVPVYVADGSTYDFGVAQRTIDYSLPASNSVGFDIDEPTTALVTSLGLINDDLVEADEDFELELIAANIPVTTVNTIARPGLGANTSTVITIEDEDEATLEFNVTEMEVAEVDSVDDNYDGYTDYAFTLTTDKKFIGNIGLVLESSTLAGGAAPFAMPKGTHSTTLDLTNGFDNDANTNDEIDFVILDENMDEMLSSYDGTATDVQSVSGGGTELTFEFRHTDTEMSKMFYIRVYNDELIEGEEEIEFNLIAALNNVDQATGGNIATQITGNNNVFVGEDATDVTIPTDNTVLTFVDDDFAWVGFETDSDTDDERAFSLEIQSVAFDVEVEGSNGVDNVFPVASVPTVNAYGLGAQLFANPYLESVIVDDPTGTAKEATDYLVNRLVAGFLEITIQDNDLLEGDVITLDGTDYEFGADITIGDDVDETAENFAAFLNTLDGFGGVIADPVAAPEVVTLFGAEVVLTGSADNAFDNDGTNGGTDVADGNLTFTNPTDGTDDLDNGEGVINVDFDFSLDGNGDMIVGGTDGFRFLVIDDEIAEEEETAVFEISIDEDETRLLANPSSSTFTLNIVDNDAMVVNVNASFVPDTITEGDSVKVILTADKAPVSDVTVQLQLVADSSDVTNDDVASWPSVTFTPTGSLTQEVWIPTNDDNIIEGFERMYVEAVISSGFGAQMVLNNFFETMVEDNDFVKVGFETATFAALEGTGGQNDQPLTVVYDANGKTNLPTVTVSIKEIAGGTATADDDYEFNEDTFVMNPANIENGKLVIARNFNIDPDDVIETDETIYFVVTTTSDDVELTNDTLEFTITNDDVSLVEFDSFGATVTEGTGSNDTIFFNVVANAPVTGTVEISVDGTTSATNFDDYTVNFADNDEVVFNQNPGITSKSFYVVVKGDAISESTETVVITLSNPSNAVQLGEKTTYTLVIKDDENPVVEGTIADAKTNGGQTLVTADVQSLNYGAGTGDVFAVISDASGSIFLDINTTSVVAGSQVLVQGEVVTKNGLEVFDASSMFVSGNGTVLAASAASAPFAAADVATAKELACVEVVDAANWTVTTNSSNNHGSYAVADVTDGTNTFSVRIDDDSPLFGSAAPVGTFDVEGFVSTETGAGFFLMAGSTLDAKANAAFTSAEVDGDGNWSFSADNTGDSYEWNIDGTSYTTQVADHKFDDTTTVSVSLTVTVDGCSHTVTKDVAVTGIGINEIANVVTNIYPNPTSGVVTVAANTEIQNVVVVNALGAIVAEIAGGSKEVEVNLSNNANGVYFVNVFANGEVIAKRIIKQ